MKVFNCPVCKVIPAITATEIKCPKCGKTAKGLNLPDTVKNWDDGIYTTKTEVKPVVVEKPVEKSVDKPVKTEKVAEKASSDEKPAKKVAKAVKKPAKKTSKK